MSYESYIMGQVIERLDNGHKKDIKCTLKVAFSKCNVHRIYFNLCTLVTIFFGTGILKLRGGVPLMLGDDYPLSALHPFLLPRTFQLLTTMRLPVSSVTSVVFYFNLCAWRSGIRRGSLSELAGCHAQGLCHGGRKSQRDI